MAITTITNHAVHPTEKDVNGGTTGAGRIRTEIISVNATKNPNGSPGFVVSGWTMPATGAGLTKTLTGGVACIDGYVIYGTGTYSFTFDASVTNYLWLQLVYGSGADAGKVTGLQVQSFTGATTYAANACYLGSVTCDGSGVTSTKDRRTQNRVVFGSVNGADGATIDAGSNFWSAAHGGTGTYTLTFGSTVFTRTPIVIPSIINAVGMIASNPTSATSCAVATYDAAGAAADRSFHFLAML